jgi:opacity protein-like surface antigen
MDQRELGFVRFAPLLVLIVTAAVTTEVMAQQGHAGGQAYSVAGVQFMWAAPQGEFGYFVDDGFGLSAHGVFSVGRQRVLGVRLEGSFILYGHERYSVPLSRTIPRVWVDVSTDNIIASGFIGPQITVGLGPLRPYLHGGVGLSYFSTYSSVHGDPCCIYHPVVSSTNFDDWVPALTGGGGLYLALSRSVMIDITGQYVHNGRVEYMTGRSGTRSSRAKLICGSGSSGCRSGSDKQVRFGLAQSGKLIMSQRRDGACSAASGDTLSSWRRFHSSVEIA